MKGIIATYSGQLERAEAAFTEALDKDSSEATSFTTVDSCQGHEKDVIILTCGRSNPRANGVGSLADQRRAGVALTRARPTLVVLGNAETLRKDVTWGALVSDAEDRGLFFDNVSPEYFGTGLPEVPSTSPIVVAAPTPPSPPKPQAGPSSPTKRKRDPSTVASASKPPAKRESSTKAPKLVTPSLMPEVFNPRSVPPKLAASAST